MIVELLIDIVGEIVVELMWYGVYDRFQYLLMKCRKRWNAKVLMVLCGILTILFWGCIIFIGIKVADAVLP